MHAALGIYAVYSAAATGSHVCCCASNIVVSIGQHNSYSVMLHLCTRLLRLSFVSTAAAGGAARGVCEAQPTRGLA
jgi:hypothetical protein